VKLANLRLKGALASDPGLAEGLNVFAGHVTHRGVAEALQLPYKPVRELLL
jgi:alanine dehydrogenase